jgi:hypothetical protein
MRVSVAGLGKELRMDFEEVLVRALEKYQIKHRIYGLISMNDAASAWAYGQLIWARPAP